MPTLATTEYCTGCTACASICPHKCIAMVSDENGFMFPKVDAEKCVGCNLCEKTCPIENPLCKEKDMPTGYAIYTKNDDVRLKSSSGGVFTEIAKEILKHKGAVFGAAYNEKFEVIHVCIEDEESLFKLRGAKYAQSDLKNIFREIKQRLNNQQEVLFSGTPCQVGGLKAFLKKEYSSLICIDFVCLSIPSPMVWTKYVKYRAEQDNEGKMPVSIELRSKKTGWSRYNYSNLFEYENGKFHAVRSGESLYMKLFGGGYISRRSCENCQFKGYSRVSDLTIGDFWGIWDIAPEMDDNKGTSVVLVQSEKGTKLINQIRDKFVMKEVTLQETSQQNRAMITTIHSNVKRDEALLMIREGNIDECKIWFDVDHKQQEWRIRDVINRIINRLKRKI